MGPQRGSGPGGADGVRVLPDELKSAARAIHRLAAEAAADLRAVDAPSHTAVAGLQGFASAGAFDSCHAAWTDHLGPNGIGRRMTSAVDTLMGNAENYLRALRNERDAVDALRRLQGWRSW